nr:hypothetical protein [Tanacetum cinerariifolium]
PATESDEVIKFSVEDLVPIPYESEGIPDTMCDVHLVNNPTPLESRYHFEIVINSNDDYSSSDDDYLYNENIEYVEASPHDSELVSLGVAKIVILEDEEIEDDVGGHPTSTGVVRVGPIKLCFNKLAPSVGPEPTTTLKDNPTPSSEFLTMSSSTSPISFLEKTNTFDDSLPELENFCFDLEEISSGSTTTHSDISLSEYDSFIFNLSNDQFPPTDRSDFTHEEFADKLAHIISPPEYDCFLFKVEPNSRDFTMDVVEDISLTKEPQVHNALPTHPNLQLNMKFQPSSEYLFTYVVWIFLSFLVYSVAPHYLLSLRNEDTIFDPGICNSYYSRPDISHRCGTFPRFKVLPESPMEIFSSTCSPMDK